MISFSDNRKSCWQPELSGWIQAIIQQNTIAILQESIFGIAIRVYTHNFMAIAKLKSKLNPAQDVNYTLQFCKVQSLQTVVFTYSAKSLSKCQKSSKPFSSGYLQTWNR